MFNASEIVGQLMREGFTDSTKARLQQAAGDGAIQANQAFDGLLGQAKTGTDSLMQAASSYVAPETLENIKTKAGSFLTDAQGNINPMAIGGITAVAGLLFGGGRGAVKGALGGTALAMLGGMAVNAMRGMASKAEAAKAAGDVAQPTGTLAAAAAAIAPEHAEAVAAAAPEIMSEASALVVLKAMINAAKADGDISDEEVNRIVGKIDAGPEGAEARKFVMQEFAKPLDLDGLVSQVTSPAVAAQVYAASLLAIEVDTPAETAYLARLAAALKLDPSTVSNLHGMVGVTA